MPAQQGYFDTLKSVAGKVFTYLASITLTGTDDKTLTVTNDTEVGQAWTTPAFDAANFTASGSMTWTVEAGDVQTYAYNITGKIMTVLFSINLSTIGGTPDTTLYIAIPGGKTATKYSYTMGMILNDAAWSASRVWVAASGTVINCIKLDGTNLASSTNLTVARGQITFEIN